MDIWMACPEKKTTIEGINTFSKYTSAILAAGKNGKKPFFPPHFVSSNVFHTKFMKKGQNFIVNKVLNGDFYVTNSSGKMFPFIDSQ